MLEAMPENIVSVVLITNAGQGFGRAIALAYGLADFDVICADKDVGLASKTAAEIEENGGQAIPVQADMSLQVDIQKVFERVYDIFGDLSGVVHVASFSNTHSFERLTEAELAELWSENLKSSFLMLRQSQRFLSEGWFVLVAPPFSQEGLHIEAMRGALGSLILAAEKSYPHINSNMVIPSRAASDPYHDYALVESVSFLGAATHGISGQRIYVDLPPPPRVSEALLPEVRAALDVSVRQDALLEPALTDGEAMVDADGLENPFDDAINFPRLEDGYGVASDENDDEGTYRYSLGEATEYLAHYQEDANYVYDEDYFDDGDYDDFGDGFDDEDYPEDTTYDDAPPLVIAEHQLRFEAAPADDFYMQEDLDRFAGFEPLALDDTAAQLEAALADDPANDWYTHWHKETKQNSTPASRAGRKRPA